MFCKAYIPNVTNQDLREVPEKNNFELVLPNMAWSHFGHAGFVLGFENQGGFL